MALDEALRQCCNSRFAVNVACVIIQAYKCERPAEATDLAGQCPAVSQLMKLLPLQPLLLPLQPLLLLLLLLLLLRLLLSLVFAHLRACGTRCSCSWGVALALPYQSRRACTQCWYYNKDIFCYLHADPGEGVRARQHTEAAVVSQDRCKLLLEGLRRLQLCWCGAQLGVEGGKRGRQPLDSVKHAMQG